MCADLSIPRSGQGVDLDGDSHGGISWIIHGDYSKMENEQPDPVSGCLGLEVFGDPSM